MRFTGPRRSLSARLLVGLLLLAGLGLVLSLGAGTLLLRDYLYDRASEQVAAVGRGPGLSAGPLAGARLCDVPDPPEALPSDFRIAIVASDGSELCRIPESASGPPVPSAGELAGRAGGDAEVLDGPGGPWATSVVELGGEGPTTYAVVAISLEDADDTVRSLLVGGLVVAVLVLALLALGAAWVIRVGLRPLTEVREAARGIGRGDLSARVPDGDPGTEVGELAAVLNSMLGDLEQAFAERQESERRIRQFAADASHELRTPLTSITGYAQLHAQLAALEEPERAQQRDDVVRRIASEADRMTRIVEDLLLLARLDRGPALVLDRVDLVEVAHDVLAAARVRHPERRLDLVVTGPVELVGDRGRLAQVVGNLVTNALVHTEAPVVVALRVDGPAVELEVSDSGPGMSEQVRAHVFDRFFRADAGRSHTSGGAGLGLSIVAALVAAHGGSVTCRSAPGTGTTFTVRLPRDPAGATPG